MPTAANVGVGKPNTAGAIYVAPATATCPTTINGSMTGFSELGYASEDGLTNSISENYDDITAWGGDNVLTTLTSSNETFQVTMIETTEAVAKEYFGASNVSTTDGVTTITSNAKEKGAHPWVFEILLSDTKKERICVPNGKVTEVGDIVYKDGEAVGYQMTIRALPDSSGNRAYRYIGTISTSSTPA